MAHWFTADTHFGHENVIPFNGRPFRSASHMDSVLIETMWEVVQAEDDLWIIGDFAAGPAAQDPDWLEMRFGQLPGARKHLVIGNHDGELTRMLGWASVSEIAEIEVDDRWFVLCHYPMITWNRARKGAIQLFGHVHGRWRGSRNAVNVGLDVWDFRPVPAAEIIARAQKQPENLHWKDVERG